MGTYPGRIRSPATFFGPGFEFSGKPDPDPDQDPVCVRWWI